MKVLFIFKERFSLARRRAGKRNNIVRYRRPRFQFDVGTILFGLIFLYLFISVVLYFTSSHIMAYEVKRGTIAEEHAYTGIAIRNEKIFNAQAAGNINFYVKEGSRVGTKTLVYTIDESGKATEALQKASAEGSTFSSENWSAIQTFLYNYCLDSYNEMNFSSIYDLKNELNGTILQILNQNMLSSMDSESVANSLKSFRASESGLIVFSTDGLEGLTAEGVNNALFDENSYQKKSVNSMELVGNGDPVYKLIMDEEWYIVIPLDETQFNRLNEEQYNENYIKIRFAKDRTEANAYVNLMESNGEKFAKLTLNSGTVRFAQDRYINVELELKGVSGLKVPNSSILEKEFFLIPEEYISTDNPNFPACVYVEKTDENGNTTLETRSITIYKTTDEGCYIAKNALSAGESLRKSAEGDERYVVGKTATLVGVYNINKGYSIFRSVNILNKNSEYSIVDADSTYGLSEYDHIVLDASTAVEAEIVY